MKILLKCQDGENKQKWQHLLPIHARWTMNEKQTGNLRMEWEPLTDREGHRQRHNLQRVTVTLSPTKKKHQTTMNHKHQAEQNMWSAPNCSYVNTGALTEEHAPTLDVGVWRTGCRNNAWKSWNNTHTPTHHIIKAIPKRWNTHVEWNWKITMETVTSLCCATK